MNSRFVGAMVLRELRSAGRRFALYGACMAIGIAAVVGLQALRGAVQEAVASQSRALLGADLRLESRTPFDQLEGVGARIAALASLSEAPPAGITRLGSMALGERSGRTRLVDVQAVEGGFPFYGSVLTNPPGRWALLQAGGREALVDRSLMLQLELEIGDTLKLGHARFVITGAIERAPGSFGLRTQIAPRVFIARRFVAETGLVQRGSLVEYLLYFRVAPKALETWSRQARLDLDRAAVRSRDVRGYQREMARTFRSLTRYLGLVGLASLALGTIGVAAGVRAFVHEKVATVAILRSLGARPREVVAVYALLAVMLGAAAGGAGIVLCLGLQGLFPVLVSDLLPIDVTIRLGVRAVATGLGLGLWATALCAIGPLIDLSAVPPLRALRRDLPAANEPGEQPRWGRLLVGAGFFLSLVLASLGQAPNWRIGIAFALGLALAVSLLAAAATLAARAFRQIPPRRAAHWLRHGVANLFRPRNHTVATTVAVGFALFLVATLHAVQHNVLRQIERDTRPGRPNLVFFDVQADQRAALESFLAERGTSIIEATPLVSARIQGLKGRPASDFLGEPELPRDLRWALRREYRLTYTDTLRESESVTAGRWWQDEERPADGAAQVSLEEGLARSLSVGVGDAIAWDIQGIRIDSVVASLRAVDWARMATNFFAIFPTGVLEQAPQSHVLVAHLKGERARAELQRDLVGQFPNISALDASVMLRAVDALLGRVGMAVGVLALFTLATGLAILVAAASASRNERMREALLLRVLGASSATVRRIALTEAVALGLLAAATGISLAVVASWALLRFVFELPFDPPIVDLLGLAAATALITAALGAAGGGTRTSTSPHAALRQAERSGAGLG